tara:strand:- start:200 stop:859 length:660 start_codon:yes stop_codon:yes gene_type:complete
MAYNLLIEDFDKSSFNYIIEEGSKDKPSRVYIEGPYMVAGKINKNKRYYVIDEMIQEVTRYTKEMISEQRAMGELNHPTHPDVDLERACHIVTELKQNGDEFMGKSKILSTPCGKIVESLIRDGVKVGMSTRSLGKLIEESGGVNRVQDMKLVAVDCVADPSYSGAFVNGILESRQWICDNSGGFCEAYDKLDNRLDNLPRKDINEHIVESVRQFLKAL